MPKTKKGNGGPVKNGGGGKKSRVAVACNLQPFYQDRAGCVAAFCAKNVNDANSLKDTNGANVVNGTNGVKDTKDSHLEVGQMPFRHCVMRNLLDEAVVCEHMLGFVRTVGRVGRSRGFLEAGVKQ